MLCLSRVPQLHVVVSLLQCVTFAAIDSFV